MIYMTDKVGGEAFSTHIPSGGGHGMSTNRMVLACTFWDSEGNADSDLEPLFWETS